MITVLSIDQAVLGEYEFPSRGGVLLTENLFVDPETIVALQDRYRNNGHASLPPIAVCYERRVAMPTSRVLKLFAEQPAIKSRIPRLNREKKEMVEVYPPTFVAYGRLSELNGMANHILGFGNLRNYLRAHGFVDDKNSGSHHWYFTAFSAKMN